MGSERLGSVIQYFAETAASAQRDLDAIGREMRPSPGPKRDEDYDAIVDMIAEARERLAESRYFLVQLYRGEYAETAAYFDQKARDLEISRALWDEPASVALLGASSVNAQREKNAAEQAKFKELAACLARCSE